MTPEERARGIAEAVITEVITRVDPQRGYYCESDEDHEAVAAMIEAVIWAAVEEEGEQCAKKADEYARSIPASWGGAARATAEEIAAIIRKRTYSGGPRAG